MTETVARPIRVMLVEDQERFRRAIALLLGREPDLEVVSEAGSLCEARRRVASVGCDVVVLDLGLPDGNGADLVSELRQLCPRAAVLIFSASLDPANLARVREAGVDEILDKLAPPAEVIGTIRRLGSG